MEKKIIHSHLGMTFTVIDGDIEHYHKQASCGARALLEIPFGRLLDCTDNEDNDHYFALFFEEGKEDAIKYIEILDLKEFYELLALGLAGSKEIFYNIMIDLKMGNGFREGKSVEVYLGEGKYGWYKIVEVRENDIAVKNENEYIHSIDKNDATII